MVIHRAYYPLIHGVVLAVILAPLDAVENLALPCSFWGLGQLAALWRMRLASAY